MAFVRRFAVLTALIVLPLALASSAQAFIYWPTTQGTDGYGIARANLQGGGIDEDFIQTPHKFPRSVVVNASHVYWTSSNAVGRAKLDGHGIDESFITGATDARGTALDANYVYWANGDSIGRASLDGSGVNHDFIPAIGALDTDFVDDVAVDSAHIYWSSWGSNAIGRANLDGTGVDENFLPGVNPHGLAVDPTYLYWATWDSVGRANVDGTNPNPTFVNDGSYGLALSGSRIYWTNVDEDTIGRANADGTSPEPGFISSASPFAPYPYGLAADALKAPGKASADNKQEQYGKKIRVGVDIKTHGSGSDAVSLDADLRGKIRVKHGRGQNNPTYDLKRLSVHLRKSSEKLIEMKPSADDQKKIVKALNHGHAAVALPTVTLTGKDGAVVTKQIRIELRRPKS